MTADQQPRTAAQQTFDSAFDRDTPLARKSEIAATGAMNRAEEVNADLGAQIAALRDTVSALQGGIDARFETLRQRVSESFEASTIVLGQNEREINRLENRIQALESPASAPESVKSVFPRTYYVGVEKEPESAPEPDPLCQCGHPKSEHFNRKPLVCCKWDYCCCEEFVPQASPATAHQEPPDAVRYYTIVLTNEQLPALNDCIFEGIANAEVEDVAAIEALQADIQKQLDAYFYGRDGAR